MKKTTRIKPKHTDARGQLVRLEDRMSKHDLKRRAVKIEARKAVAENLALHIGQAKLMAMTVAAAVRRSDRIHYSIEAGLVLAIVYLFFLQGLHGN